MKLSKAVTDKIAQAIKEGDTIGDACYIAGIGRTAYYNWIRRAEELLDDMPNEGEDEPPDDPNLYLYFYFEVGKAHRTFKRELIKEIKESAKTHWQAAAWMLERRYPQDYARSLIKKEDETEDKLNAGEPQKTPEQLQQEEEARRKELEAEVRQEYGIE